MKSIKFSASACKYCRYYNPEGRRGGQCQQLGAPVLGSWKACSLALPPFAPSWETLEDVWSLPEVKPTLASHFGQHVHKEPQETSTCNAEAPVESLVVSEFIAPVKSSQIKIADNAYLVESQA
jgi:hypothetical protein